MITLRLAASQPCAVRVQAQRVVDVEQSLDTAAQHVFLWPREIVLDNLRTALPSRRPAMAQELRAVGRTDISLAAFLAETGLELNDVYRSGCWYALKRDAGIAVPAARLAEVEGWILGVK